MSSKRSRWLLISAIGLTALLVVAAVTLPALLDVERYRDRIERELTAATGWKAELGEIQFSVLRGMVLAVRPARLAAPGDSSSFDIESIEIRAELFPLLSGRLNVRNVELVRPDIRLVQLEAADGWVLPGSGSTGRTAGEPAPPGEADSTGADPAPAKSGTASAPIEINIERIAVQNGRLRLEDRSGEPPLELAIVDLDFEVEPASGRLSGAGRLDEEGGSFRIKGRPSEQIELSLEGIPSGRLRPLLGPGLVHEGGLISGEVRFSPSAAIESELRGSGIRLLSGERPFDELDLELAVRPEGESWLLDRLRLVGDGLEVGGTGKLAPELDLQLQIPSTPLDVALRASESILPLPLDLTGPGTFQAELEVDQPSGGELSYTARGTLSAAAFRASEVLPPVEQARANFTLDRQGRLEVRLLDGSIAGGPVDGVARLASVDPPGRLTFEGGLQDAVLGALLSGLIGDSAERIRGSTGVRASLGLDLAAAQLDARSISGRLDLDSRQVSLPGWDLEGAIRKTIERKLGGLEELAARAGKKLKREEGSAAAEAVEQLLSGLQAKIDFDTWPWKLERLALDAGDLVADGSGTFDAEKGTVDLRFSARLAPQKSAELVAKTKELRILVDDQGRLTLPVRVKGALLSPSVEVDLGEALSRKLGGQKTEDKVKSLLKGLLDRD